jgi:hypothetical protein
LAEVVEDALSNQKPTASTVRFVMLGPAFGSVIVIVTPVAEVVAVIT